MATNVEIRRSSGTNFNEVVHLKTSVGLIDGLLDENNQIAAQWLPNYILGGMRFVTTVGGPDDSPTLNDIHDILNDFILLNGGSLRGCYVIFTATTTMGVSQEYLVFAGEERGVVTGAESVSVDVENGDWLICITDDGERWAIMNNKYQDATTTNKGVVRLATEAEGTDGTLVTLAMTPKATIKAINDRAYVHNTQTAISINSLSDEVIDTINVNTEGHVTSVTKKVFRTGNESATGILQLASSTVAKTATNTTYATSPARVKEMIDKFASIPLVQTLPTDMTDHPVGKLIMLKL